MAYVNKYSDLKYKYKYKYKYWDLKYKYKYKYFKLVLEYNSSTSTSTKYYMSASYSASLGDRRIIRYNLIHSVSQ